VSNDKTLERKLKPVNRDVLLTQLDQRLTAAASVLLADCDEDYSESAPGTASISLLPRLLDSCVRAEQRTHHWLVLTAAFGAFPSSQKVLEFGRMLELTPLAQAESGLLGQIVAQPLRGRLDLPMRVVQEGVIVEVNNSARKSVHTGIQRTVRELLPRWKANHQQLNAVAWIDPWCAFRNLRPAEYPQVFNHKETTLAGQEHPAMHAPPYRLELVVPWRSSVVLPDVFSLQAKDELAAMARYSGNVVSMIGYDLIPITSAEMRPMGEGNGTAAYLSMVKHAHRVAGISRSAATEFTGFTHSLRAQGLIGPEVREIRLASEPLRDETEAIARRPRSPRPIMLCLGTQEPHKNQRAALHAAERLWNEGLDFEVHLVGGKGWTDEVLKPAISRLLDAGRPIQNLGRVSDARLAAEMKSADFAYFASLHEGFGLPVAEALASGTPVVTSNFGSQAEIGELGGCLLVDPRDDDQVTSAIRSLVTDNSVLARLRAEAAALIPRTWDEYASDLWDFVSPTEVVS